MTQEELTKKIWEVIEHHRKDVPHLTTSDEAAIISAINKYLAEKE